MEVDEVVSWVGKDFRNPRQPSSSGFTLKSDLPRNLDQKLLEARHLFKITTILIFFLISAPGGIEIEIRSLSHFTSIFH